MIDKAEHYLSPAQVTNSIALIGGGVASAFLADALLATNPHLNVTIYCQDSQLAAGASGNEQGAVYPHLQGSRSVLAEISACCFEYAIDYYHRLSQKLPSEFDIEFCGVLQQAYNQELEQRLRKVHEVWPELTEFVDAKSSSEFAGVTLPFASLWFKQGCWLSPKQLTRALIKTLCNSFELQVRLNCEINLLQKLDTKWHLTTKNNNVFKHDAVVVCSGYASAQFSQTQFLPIEPIRGQVSQLNQSSSLSPLKTVLCHKGYVTPKNSDIQCFGATFQKDDVDTSVRAEDNQTNMDQIQSIYSEQSWCQALTIKDIAAAKAGIRGNSPDHCPIVGEVFSPSWILNNVNKNTGQFNGAMARPSENAGLYILTGLGARGLTTGPLMAKHLSAQILQKQHVLPSPLTQGTSPSRFLIRQLKKTKGKHPWFTST